MPIVYVNPCNTTVGPVALGRWAEARLHECVGFGFPAARLYGLDVIDREAIDEPPSVGGSPGARLCFVGDDASTSGLVLGPTAVEACRFDAAVLLLACRTRTGRRRVLVLVAGTGTATVVRLENDPEGATFALGLAAGGTAGRQLAAVWSGLRGDDGRPS